MPMTVTPLVPKDPSGPLTVVALGRISTVHQDIENIEASHRYIQEYLGHVYQGPMHITLLGEQASGMLTDRATIREAEEMVASGRVDLMIAEDLARIYRNPRHQYRFVQDCVDQGTRVICVGDNLDTADENWEITMGAAALRHGLHIPDTRRRVRRTATHSFHKGGMVQKIRYGYRRLSTVEAASGEFGPKDLRVARRPECTPVIREMMTRVLRGDPYAAVADWLEAEGIAPGAYVVGRRWNARVVVELLDDPILSGTRTFRDTICRPIFRTGKHKPVKNTEPETENCPELAHLSQEEHAALRREIARRRAALAVNGLQARKRQGIPRSRSIWPGQAATCGICGGLMYYHGASLKCASSLARAGSRCWNRVQVPAALARQRVATWLIEQANHDPHLREALVEFVWRQLDRSAGGCRRHGPDLAREITNLQRQAANVTTAIAEGGQMQALIGRLRTIEDTLQKAQAQQSAQQASTADAENRLSRTRVASQLEEHLLELMGRSFELADLLRRAFPEFVIQPMQALDCEQVRPQARFCFRTAAVLAAVEDPARRRADVPDLQAKLDLFDPPLHVRHLRACLETKAAHPSLSLKGVAQTLGINHMTVKRAFDYARLMQGADVSEPYRDVRQAPHSASRWRRQAKRPDDRPTERIRPALLSANS